MLVGLNALSTGLTESRHLLMKNTIFQNIGSLKMGYRYDNKVNLSSQFQPDLGGTWATGANFVHGKPSKWGQTLILEVTSLRRLQIET